MRYIITPKWVLAIVFSLLVSLPADPVFLSAEEEGTLEIFVKANLNGFFNANDQPLRNITVKKGSRIKLVFQYDESTLDAYRTGNRHQFAVVSKETGFRLESNEISFWNKKVFVEFVAGRDGSNRYRVICIVDCVGMDLLGYTVPLNIIVT